MLSYPEKVRRRAQRFVDRVTGISDAVIDTVMRRRERELVIIDDIFPHVLSAFRIAEYNRYLRAFPSAQVHSTGTAFQYLGADRTFLSVRREYERLYPEFRGRVRRFRHSNRLDGAVAYLVFLNNAYNFLRYVERDRMPLVFTLYPGGGFELKGKRSDEMLRKVCDYPRLEKVIVTQVNTRDYLLDNGFVKPSQIEFVYGGVFPSDRLPSTREEVKKADGAIDICFVAHKYMPGGIDKGYDVFVDFASRLASRLPNVKFHVVGPFDARDADVRSLGDRIRFHGTKLTEFFAGFYSQMDMIVSPNKPFVLLPGAFDGFPTGACMEAGMSGVGVFCTDELKLNVTFRPDEEIVIIPTDPAAICEIVSRYCVDRDALSHLKVAGQKAFRRALDIEHQMAPRVGILNDVIARNGSPSTRVS